MKAVNCRTEGTTYNIRLTLGNNTLKSHAQAHLGSAICDIVLHLFILKPRLTKFRKSGIAVYTTTVISRSIAKRYLRQVGISITNNSIGEQMQKES